MTKTLNKPKYERNRSKERFMEYHNQRVMMHDGEKFVMLPKFGRFIKITDLK